MRYITILAFLVVAAAGSAADLESRALTNYIPQDLLETVVRKDAWTEIVLKPYNGVRKGDVARIWSGGVIDHGGGNQPGVNVAGPEGLGAKSAAADASRMS